MSSINTKMKDRKKKRTRRFSQSDHMRLRRYTGLPKQTRRLSKIGLVELKLSTIAQRAINCIIGDNITFEHPWIYIQKEKIEDNLEFYPKHSEFLPVQKYIENYPDPEMLICLRRQRILQEQNDVFYICATVEVREIVLQLLDNHLLKMKNFLSMEKSARPWKTLGSEQEILDENINIFRPLLAIEIECEFPIFKTKRKFSLALAYPNHLRFAEIIGNERATRLVYKRRNTHSSQAAAIVTNASSQTMQVCQMNQNSQWEFDKKVKPFEYRALLFFLNETMSTLKDTILVNANINLYRNDYELLKSQSYQKIIYSQISLKYFRDVKLCRKKFVSALVWHPKISGLIAVAYSHMSRNHIYQQKQKFRKLEFVDNVVLIWCYTCSLAPKLILHSGREIISLCFCPYNKNILIGGCTNGQIIVWDLTNKLELVESEETMLTPKQEKHRAIISSHTKWMSFEKSLHIKPTAVSNFIAGHTSEVTCITWISANCEYSKNGTIIEPIKSADTWNGRQFITCALDGAVYIWDMTSKYDMVRNKTQRLNLNLFGDVSPFYHLNNTMIPIFKICIQSPYKFLPLTNILMYDQEFMYEVQNPKTRNNRFARTYFKAIETEYPKKFANKLNLITGLGTLLSFSWSGHDYDQGKIVNFAKTDTVTIYNWVHDTPISNCCINPIDNDLLLTIGGKMFAIWNIKLDNKPLLWRKNSIRYCSGVWSVNNVGIIVLFRVDSKLEFWDILGDLKSPTRILNQSGLSVVDSFLDCKVSHVTKQTFFKSDRSGNLVLNSLMSEDETKAYESRHNELVFVEFVEGILKRREAHNKWVDCWKKKYIKPIEEIDLENPEAEMIPVQSKSLIKDDDTEDTKDDYETRVFKAVSENDKIRANEIEKYTAYIINQTVQKTKRQNKMEEFLKTKGQIFESYKKPLLGITEKKKISKPSKKTTIRDEIKKMYLQNYNEMEKNVIEIIRKNPFLRRQVPLPCLIESRRSSYVHVHFQYGEQELINVFKQF